MRGDQGSSGWQEKLFMWFLYAVDEPACGKAFNVEGAQNVNMIIVTLPYEEKKSICIIPMPVQCILYYIKVNKFFIVCVCEQIRARFSSGVLHDKRITLYIAAEWVI